LHDAHALALEIARRLDAGARAHINAVVPEDFRERDRDRDEWAISFALQAHIGGERHFGGVEFAGLQHARKRLARPHHPQVEVDAVRLHAAVHERAGAIVVPARQRER
jgi:hypothetical protein